MRLGIRAHDTKYAPLDEMVANIHNMGFHCMHIALAKSIKEFKPEIETMTPGLAMYMKEICRKNDVDVAVLATRIRNSTKKSWINILHRFVLQAF